jgi:hypothetical protein
VRSKPYVRFFDKLQDRKMVTLSSVGWRQREEIQNRFEGDCGILVVLKEDSLLKL